METSPAKVVQYFSGEKQNLIPLFQRPYRWKEINWQTLWDDLLIQYELEASASHFMGAIVSVPARSTPVGVNKFLIIDGQQRLTTVSILLCALRDCFIARGENDSASRIHEVYLINKFRDIDDTLKFVPTQADREIYRAIALDKITPEDSDHLMVGCYKFFKKKITHGNDSNGDSIDIKKVRNTLEHKLQVVMINLSEEDDPYLIFESLNFKGAPLTQADLVRNYILMQFKHSISTGGDQERIYNTYWRHLEHTLGDNLTNFLRHYAMKDGDNIPQGGIYAAIKSKIQNNATPGEVEVKITELTQYGSFYEKILCLYGIDTVIGKRLQNIKELNVTVSYPLLLRLFHSYQSKTISTQDLEKALAILESFVVRRAVCGIPTNTISKLFLLCAKSLQENNQLQWLNNFLSKDNGNKRFPSDAEFFECFKKQPQYGRASTRYVLEQLEISYGHHESVNLNTTTVEHVLPQTLTDDWRQELAVKNPEEIHSAILNTFGNLTLTGYNSELSNHSFLEKKKLYAESNIKMNSWFSDKNSWNEQQITARAEYMANKALNLWAGPV